MKIRKRELPAHVEAFKALAHAGRLQVFLWLASGRGWRSAGEIRAALGLPAPTLSHHLDQLRRAGLLLSRRRQRFIYYAAARPRVLELTRLLGARV